jgi:flagellar biosynthesis protein FlhF
MQIKRFEAKNMTTALRLIKGELGPDAVILTARSLRKGKGLFGSMKYAGVEVTAAIDNQQLAKNNVNYSGRKSIYPAWERSRIKDRYRFEKKAVPRPTGYSSKILLDGHRSYSARRDDIKDNHKAISDIYQQMLSQEIDRGIASEIIEEIKRRRTPLEKIDGKDLGSHLTLILEEMGVMVDGDVFGSGTPRIAAFIGGSGVGKTTTIAKLAFLQSKQYKKRVGLITLDNYGIAAIEEVKAYAKIIGIPLETVVNSTELKQSIKQFKDKELIIIDTPGVNPHNKKLIREIKGYFASLSDLQTHLVLSAPTKERDLIAIADAFNEMNIHRLLFTKIDESSSYGNIINLLIRTNIPISFLCTGRRVPDDIEVGSTKKLVELLFKPQSVKDRQSVVSSLLSESSANALENLPTDRTFFVANQNSDVYHSSNCKWSKKIKPENIIKFYSVQEAEARNFLACSSCKPDRQHVTGSFNSKSENINLLSYRSVP